MWARRLARVGWERGVAGGGRAPSRSDWVDGRAGRAGAGRRLARAASTGGRGGRGEGAVSLGSGRREGGAGVGRAPSRSDWVEVGCRRGWGEGAVSLGVRSGPSERSARNLARRLARVGWGVPWRAGGGRRLARAASTGGRRGWGEGAVSLGSGRREGGAGGGRAPSRSDCVEVRCRRGWGEGAVSLGLLRGSSTHSARNLARRLAQHGGREATRGREAAVSLGPRPRAPSCGVVSPSDLARVAERLLKSQRTEFGALSCSGWSGAWRGGRGQGAVSLGLGRREGGAGGGRAPPRSAWVEVGRQGGCKGWGQGAPSRSDRSGGAESECQSARAFDRPVKYKTLPRSSHYEFCLTSATETLKLTPPPKPLK